MSEEKELTFEEAMAKLEEIVEKLEEGNVPLEQAISFFQEGMKLSKLCHDKLQNVEKQMEYILREDGQLAPFSLQEEE
ncbi:exodeoxyribonuclease VII small subunit [Parageobacillus thermoglucosidasius]|jgi:exodeoxyribonuclease VII small subunit|uniref:Exodeoxyribonuclease 7 small subunit n=2 Tax=Parageobacillus thermoglucosidasius TaxID=1426 RepID=A0AB38QVA8_PARTM|nr:exodeoxyribonuclease VII small subunit [Parageobacillus thermoglucosidasius]KYD13680.1 Exodeoxyribonuclease VII small subunit [Anoxybacillus flavithermus]REK55559.1 MAG: exodeoxyribonuclease VII small subunit [Geobacillus sp.]AEH47278.1 Exodeoxyribonuclease 7 small subunit [Parageobacillus thermoglucosidasius C56-YS93]ALF11473.1 exodeoxyribonuclease VII small subunit [Parageobacillus thermoglucosidasius]ANZ31552.1 exodeoxyribonuclease VII small subunit [Parageobacillus thermoglucosidasius]